MSVTNLLGAKASWNGGTYETVKRENKKWWQPKTVTKTVWRHHTGTVCAVEGGLLLVKNDKSGGLKWFNVWEVTIG